ncbi:MAG: hypothetical protein MUE55_06275 [Thermoplasmata archaeon]|jgi:hypothetical protein|nr:hypothetical protein [Thermoplasmata archaeon]
MTNRYNISQLIMESKAPLMNDGFRRRTSGEKYWLLVPFAIPFFSLMIYSFVAWLAFLGFSDAAGRLRARITRKNG